LRAFLDAFLEEGRGVGKMITLAMRGETRQGGAHRGSKVGGRTQAGEQVWIAGRPTWLGYWRAGRTATEVEVVVRKRRGV
jgi:hypothetical protein